MFVNRLLTSVIENNFGISLIIRITILIMPLNDTCNLELHNKISKQIVDGNRLVISNIWTNDSVNTLKKEVNIRVINIKIKSNK